MLGNMIEFLKQYQELITLLFTIAVGISTIVYACLTAKLVSETKRMRKAQTDPEVSITLIHNDISISFIDLLVKNIGMGPAYDIKFKVLKDFELLKGRMLSEVGFIKYGIKYFSPNQSMRLYLASFIDNPKELEKKEIEISVSYKNSIGELFNRPFVLSFSQFSALLNIGSPPLHKIAENMEKIQRSLDQVIDGFKTINVNIYDTEDREEKEKKIQKEYEDYKKSQENKE